MATPQAITAETAIARALLWLGALIEAADCEPAETTLTVRVSGEGARAGETLSVINLADDMAVFAALGFPIPDFAERD